MTVLDDARAMSDDLVQLRHRLHQQPELGLDLPWTQEQVLAAIDGLPLEVTTGTTSLGDRGVAWRRPATRGRAVLLRGDMDALPVQERTGLDYAADRRDDARLRPRPAHDDARRRRASARRAP